MRYFEILLEMVQNFSDFDVVGHLDYIIRYGPFEEKSYNFRDFEEIIDLILKEIIRKGKGLELNTSGLRGPLNTTFPREEVLKRFRGLGGKRITVGSDSHFNSHYHAGIMEGIGYLKSMGYLDVSSFTGREEVRIRI